MTLPAANFTFSPEDGSSGEEHLETTTIMPDFLIEPESNGSLIIFDRLYDEGNFRGHPQMTSSHILMFLPPFFLPSLPQFYLETDLQSLFKLPIPLK